MVAVAREIVQREKGAIHSAQTQPALTTPIFPGILYISFHIIDKVPYFGNTAVADTWGLYG
jgi:hypothetical protein